MNKELKDVIKRKNDDFFSFTYGLKQLLDKWRPVSVYDLSVYTCINGFCQSAMNYSLSVAEDVARLDYKYMPKAMMNRLLLRNCLEAYLILTILQERPQYSEKYFATKTDDSERIELLYSNQENEKRFLKRFEWLPRLKGRRATSTKDLLKYIHFEDQEEALFIETLIKNLDKFIHPSFHYAKNIDQDQSINDGAVIYSLYIDEGLIDELKQNMYNTVKSLRILPDFVEVFQKRYSIMDYISQSKIKTPMEVTSGILEVSATIKQFDFETYKGKGCVYLLQDLVPRYDDLLQSAYSNNALLFFIQARYIIEAIATLSILMDEDEERNYIYHIHQTIKNFEAQSSSRAFLKIEEDMCAENLRNISLIKDYYKKQFQVDVEENKVTRLSGWALYLKELNNSEPINSPHFVSMLGNAVFEDEETVRKLLVFYEESNAYTHITPYAFCKESLSINLMEVLGLINFLVAHIMRKIISEFAFASKLDPQKLINIESQLFSSIHHLHLMEIN